MNVGNLITGSFAFSKFSLNIWNGSSFHVLLKPGLENFKHCFARMWDECNCAVVWTFFGIALCWDWPFLVLWALLSFPNLLASIDRIGEGSGTPLQYSCLENPMGRGAWWAAIYGVAQSQTRLKRLSSSSSSIDRIMWFFFISLLMWISIEFQMLNQPCLPGINLTWIVIFVCIVGFDLLIFCWVFCVCIHVKSGL